MERLDIKLCCLGVSWAERFVSYVCVSLVGVGVQPAGVGKTCIAKRFLHDTFTDMDPPTVG